MRTQNSQGFTKRLTAATALALTVAGCGASGSQESASDLEWTQSRSTTTQYAYLDDADLVDEFLFGASVIHVENFMSGALNMVVRPMNVRLHKEGSGNAQRLEVRTSEEDELLMGFDLARRNGRNEIDFGSAGNDLTLQSLVSVLGGIYTAMDENGLWVSQGAPTVARIQQDKDTVVVDLVHTVSQVLAHRDISGRLVIDEVLSESPGDVTVRVFLKRKKALPSLGASRTVGASLAQNIGYFGTSLADEESSSKIQRFALGDGATQQSSITFHLKNVPAEFKDVARQAILSWNQAFDADRIRVADAPEWMDVGDPRYNVVKWFDGLDEDVNWAGVAKMIVEPDTGLVMGGHLYLNGGSVLEMYRGITAYSQEVAAGGLEKVSGTIGNATFDRDEGEAPVVPYLSDLTQDYESYMQGYYLETIAHEVGHVLGLRHNFRATTALTDNQSASVMDYAPRGERAHYAGPGFYDIAAIQWGYFGRAPERELPFCTDDDIWAYYDCSQGDWGDAVDSAVHGLLDGTMLLTKSTVPVTDDVLISSMAGSLENALKIKKLQSQLPASIRAEAVQKIDAAYNYLHTVEPDAALSGNDLETVKANLAKLRELVQKREAELREAGRL